MLPPIGYQGGKRRLLPRLRLLFEPGAIRYYAEPFVGMGALYLDLRARGFKGPAVLADSHPDVVLYWKLIHSEQGEALVAEAEKLGEAATRELFVERLQMEPEEPVKRAATFLWLTNFAFGNCPPKYRGPRQGWGNPGTKLGPSAERWGKKFSWAPCVGRLRVIAKRLAGARCHVLDDGKELLDRLTAPTDVYADPPYYGQSTNYYVSPKTGHLLKSIIDCRAGMVVLSEAVDLRAHLKGWTSESSALADRMSQGRGNKGQRAEWLYTRRAPR